MAFMGVTPGGMLVAVIVLCYVLDGKRKSAKKVDKLEKSIDGLIEGIKKTLDNDIENMEKKIDTLYNLVRKVENDNSANTKRLDMHADHFDVVDKDTERAKEVAHRCLKLCQSVIYRLNKR